MAKESVGRRKHPTKVDAEAYSIDFAERDRDPRSINESKGPRIEKRLRERKVEAAGMYDPAADAGKARGFAKRLKERKVQGYERKVK